ncbi:MAG: DNA-processing protein DprA [Anaerolineae bacterium]|nr:DNA-processing protein DprA [Anaerolineae bacterium]
MVDYPEVVYWLTLVNESGLKLNLVKSIVQRWSVVEKRAVANLFDLSPLEWSTTFGLTDDEAEQVSALSDKLARQAKALDRWQAQGLEPLLRTDPRYPQRLAHILPPATQPLLLWGRGNLSLLNEPAVAVLGEQPPDEATAEFVDELMQVLVDEEIGLVSGYGRGLDRSTFEKMLATPDGRAMAVIPMGLGAFVKTTTKLETAVDAGQIALVSPFAPDIGFEERFAEARNLLIDHLALALLVLDPSQDAQARAGVALERGLPVLVRLSDTATNRSLIDKGALLLTDTGEVVEMVQQAMIDDTMLEQAEQEPLSPIPSLTTPLVLPDSNDDYALRAEDIEPIASDEALEILSMGGDVPEILRRRLKKSENDD